jgi:hypothetical protein
MLSIKTDDLKPEKYCVLPLILHFSYLVSFQVLIAPGAGTGTTLAWSICNISHFLALFRPYKVSLHLTHVFHISK